MGNFDTVATAKFSPNLSRSVFKNTIGPDSANNAQDLHIITQTLSSAGLLHEQSSASSTHAAIFHAIRHAKATLNRQTPPPGAQNSGIDPGDETERAVRRAVANGRLPLSHRAICTSTAPKEPKAILTGGMQRALAKLNEQHSRQQLTSPLRRALLPVVSPQTFQSNRRLAEALVNSGQIEGLEILIAGTLRENGKQGFSDVRDFFAVLQKRAPQLAEDLFQDTLRHLDGHPLRLFRKLYLGQPPIEGDFN